MRTFGRLGAGLAGIGVVVACCALGPAAILAGVGVAVAGLGVGAWSAIAAGVVLVAVGVVIANTQRRRRRADPGASCAVAAPPGETRR